VSVNKATTGRGVCHKHDGLRRDSPAQAACTKEDAAARSASLK